MAILIQPEKSKELVEHQMFAKKMKPKVSGLSSEMDMEDIFNHLDKRDKDKKE
jgi:hypothetical protein